MLQCLYFCLDAQTAISFLKTYGLDKDFKVSDFQVTCFEDLFLTLLERYYPRYYP